MVLSAVLLSAGGAAFAADGLSKWLDREPEFLPVDEAFRLTTELGADGAVLARWEMPDGYYLYRHRFDFTTRALDGGEGTTVKLGEAEIPPGKRKVDEYFGEVEVYYHEAQARVPVAAGEGPVEVGISYQGCADAGLCYPPETRWVAFNLGAAPGAATAPDAGSAGSDADGAGRGSGVPASDEQTLASLLSSGGMLTALLLFFVGGIGLAFTPCVLPMVPILSSIIVGESASITRARAFSLSSAYVIGMASTYAVVGTLVGLFGAGLNLQAMLQSTPVLVLFAAVFVLLSLSMFGYYELQLPASWQNGLNRLGNRVGGGKHLSVLVMGALSALVVSPCVSAPLAGALIYLSTTGDALLGGGALLVLGLGMGVPLLIIGSSGGHLLPRAGGWMTGVKAVFGVALLAVAVWLLERVVPPAVTLGLWAALAIGTGVYLGALDFASREGIRQLWKAGGAFSFIYGVLLLIGAASGAQDPLKPLAAFGIAAGTPEDAALRQPEWHAVADLPALRAELAMAQDDGQMALLDLYADWCISCKVMERSVFPLPEVDSRLRQFRLLRADVTENDVADRQLMNAFGLFGPPSLVFFSAQGRELSNVRIQGEITADRLATHLQAVLDEYDVGVGAAFDVGADIAPAAAEIAAAGRTR
jgi:thiol:disulfide interchange protein DsbD